MAIFYNIIAIVNLINAVLMLRCGALANEQQQEFRLVSKVLHIVYILTGLSMFAAQFEQKLPHGEFQILNPLMLLFFYLIGQGIIYTLIILFKAKNTAGYIKHTIPILALFAVYTIAYFIFDDQFIYSFDDYFVLLPHSPMLMFRSLLLVAISGSLVYGIIICHRECRESNKRIVGSLSELDFQRGIVISKFMWSVKALSIWSFLTYFYTTPTLEIVSCSLITLVLTLQLIGFKDFLLSRNSTKMRVLTISGEMEFEVDREEIELKQQLRNWLAREDKPYTRNSLSIGEVAKEMGVPKNKLSVYINSKEGTFRSWINNLRIEDSKQLLETKREMSISEIAEYAGFCDLPAFSRAFKKATGVSPKLYRNKSCN